METRLRSEQFALARQEEMQALYPAIFFGAFRYIDRPSQYILIDDIAPGADLFPITQYCRNNVEVLSMHALVNGLTDELRRFLERYDPKEVLLLYPGGGGRRFQQALPAEFTNLYRSLHVTISRTRNLETGEREPYMTEDEQSKLRAAVGDNENEQTIVVCDDAINGGGTLRYMRQIAQGNATWAAATAVLFSPLPKAATRHPPSSIEGFDRLFSAQVLEGYSNPVPLNFLSSLMTGNLLEDRRINEYLLGNCSTEEEASELLQMLFAVQSTLKADC